MQGPQMLPGTFPASAAAGDPSSPLRSFQRCSDPFNLSPSSFLDPSFPSHGHGARRAALAWQERKGGAGSGPSRGGGGPSSCDATAQGGGGGPQEGSLSGSRFCESPESSEEESASAGTASYDNTQELEPGGLCSGSVLPHGTTRGLDPPLKNAERDAGFFRGTSSPGRGHEPLMLRSECTRKLLARSQTEDERGSAAGRPPVYPHGASAAGEADPGASEHALGPSNEAEAGSWRQDRPPQDPRRFSFDTEDSDDVSSRRTSASFHRMSSEAEEDLGLRESWTKGQEKDSAGVVVRQGGQPEENGGAADRKGKSQSPEGDEGGIVEGRKRGGWVKSLHLPFFSNHEKEAGNEEPKGVNERKGDKGALDGEDWDCLSESSDEDDEALQAEAAAWKARREAVMRLTSSHNSSQESSPSTTSRRRAAPLSVQVSSQENSPRVQSSLASPFSVGPFSHDGSPRAYFSRPSSASRESSPHIARTFAMPGCHVSSQESSPRFVRSVLSPSSASREFSPRAKGQGMVAAGRAGSGVPRDGPPPPPPGTSPRRVGRHGYAEDAFRKNRSRPAASSANSVPSSAVSKKPPSAAKEVAPAPAAVRASRKLPNLAALFTRGTSTPSPSSRGVTLSTPCLAEEDLTDYGFAPPQWTDDVGPLGVPAKHPGYADPLAGLLSSERRPPSAVAGSTQKDAGERELPFLVRRLGPCPRSVSSDAPLVHPQLAPLKLTLLPKDAQVPLPRGPRRFVRALTAGSRALGGVILPGGTPPASPSHRFGVFKERAHAFGAFEADQQTKSAWNVPGPGHTALGHNLGSPRRPATAGSSPAQARPDLRRSSAGRSLLKAVTLGKKSLNAVKSPRCLSPSSMTMDFDAPQFGRSISLDHNEPLRRKKPHEEAALGPVGAHVVHPQDPALWFPATPRRGQRGPSKLKNSSSWNDAKEEKLERLEAGAMSQSASFSRVGSSASQPPSKGERTPNKATSKVKVPVRVETLGSTLASAKGRSTWAEVEKDMDWFD